MFKAKYSALNEIYPDESVETQKERYRKALETYKDYFKSDGNLDTVRIFSTPGRTEIGGNHTDHNNGKVLAASVDLDVIAIVEPIEASVIAIKSEGFPEDKIDISVADVIDEEKNTAAALIRGVAKGFLNKGFKIGGFKAYTTSNVLSGSGLSSSAAFEVLVGTILSYLYNDGSISPIKIAQIAQFAENKYFGKPSGLMDQMACSVGGFIAIDFKDTAAPIVEEIKADFASYNHALCIIDTKADHADLTDDYAAIPREMKEIAGHFDVDVLRKIVRHDLVLNVTELREKYGDRALLRAFHYFDENERVDKLSHALKEGDFDNFLKYVNESGDSSFKYLQNINVDVKNQAVAIALYIAKSELGGKGAARVHGGGFAGTIQAFVPLELVKRFRYSLETVYGPDSCHVLTIRPVGSTEVNKSFLHEDII